MPTTASLGTSSNCRGTHSRSHGRGGNGWHDAPAQGGSHGTASARSSHVTRFPAPRSFTGTQRERNSPAKNRMREICTSGTARGEGGNILTYSASGGSVGFRKKLKPSCSAAGGRRSRRFAGVALQSRLCH